jgi:hypothetical protein
VKFFIKILFLIFSLIATTQAKQLNFTKKVQENNYTFSYQWLDYKNVRQSIQFNLTKPALFERFRILKPYQSKLSQKTILHRIKKQLRQEPLTDVRVVFTQQQDKKIIQVTGQDDAKVKTAYQKINDIEQKVTKEYFKRNYYQHFTMPDQKTGIKVDHVKIAQHSVADFKELKPIILNKVPIEDVRQVTNFVLNFVQSIPYSTLESRLNSSGAGFNPPAKLLWENQGDCDSKMTLTATILRALMPRMSMTMIYIDQHAFIGIAVTGKKGEMSIQYQGVNYLLADPTGPALYPLGRLGPDSELAINQERYVVEKFHYDDSI